MKQENPKPINTNTTRQAWQIERINTAPMTLQQYNFAVTALAALIKQWIHTLETMNHNNNAAQEQDTSQEQGDNDGATNQTSD
jgi:hypothetical protein